MICTCFACYGSRIDNTNVGDKCEVVTVKIWTSFYWSVPHLWCSYSLGRLVLKRCWPLFQSMGWEPIPGGTDYHLSARPQGPLLVPLGKFGSHGAVSWGFETQLLTRILGVSRSKLGASLSIVFFGGAIQLCIFIPIWDTRRYTELFFGAYLWVNSIITLILGGVVVSSFFSAHPLFKYIADPYSELPALTFGPWAVCPPLDISSLLPSYPWLWYGDDFSFKMADQCDVYGEKEATALGLILEL